jgi:hypothetical protein
MLKEFADIKAHSSHYNHNNIKYPIFMVVTNPMILATCWERAVNKLWVEFEALKAVDDVASQRASQLASRLRCGSTPTSADAKYEFAIYALYGGGDAGVLARIRKAELDEKYDEVCRECTVQ